MRFRIPLPRVLRQHLARQDGAVIVIFALMLPVMLAGLALAVETGSWFAAQRKLQHTADAAVYSAAVGRVSGDSDAMIEATVRRVAQAAGLRADSDAVSVTFPEEGRIQVVLSDSRPYAILRALDVLTEGPDRFGGALSLSARAVATIGTREDGPPPVCLYVLDRRDDDALSLNDDARLDLPRCSIEVSSTDSDAVEIGNRATITAACMTVAGGIDRPRRVTTTVCPEPRTYSTPAPLPDEILLIRPPANPRSVPRRNLGSSEFVVEATHLTHPSGVPMRRFQGGLTLRSNRTYNFGPGLFIIDGGSFNVGERTVLNAVNGTAFFLMDSAKVEFNNRAIVRLSGMTSGPWRNVVLFDSNDEDSEEFHELVAAQLDGIVYMPRGEVEFMGGSSTGSGCFLIAVGQFILKGSARLTAECGPSNAALPGFTGNSPDVTGTDIQLTE